MTVWLTAAACAAAAAAAPCEAQTAGGHIDAICEARAHNAQRIAKDRDAGVSRQAEWLQAQRVAGAMPVGRQAYALAEMGAFIDGLYGRYAKLAPQQVYTKYLAYCEGQHPQ